MASKKNNVCVGCGETYHGWGKKFCSWECSQGKQAPDSDALFRPISIHVTPKKVSAAKAARGASSSVHYGDVHFPFHDTRALSIRNQILELVSPALVVDHGDTLDCTSISKYPKDPHARISLHTERQMAAKDFGEVTALTPQADHIWFEGNHEERLKRLLWKAADTRELGEILTMPEVAETLDWGKLLGLDSLGWKVVPYPRHLLLHDKLILIHGNTVRTHSAYSAKAEHDRFGKSGLSGHTHRQGAFFHTDYNGIHAWHELGMLGQVRADYVAHANWQQGMGVVTWSADFSRWGFEPISIHDGVAYFRGLRFEG